jgi:solute carrier family 13 (sodium-dependent dicarboxylate transporter), member 2/3/5
MLWWWSGFLFVTAFLSMWLSNTATAAMMAPLAVATMEHLLRGADRPRGQSNEPLADARDAQAGRPVTAVAWAGD